MSLSIELFGNLILTFLGFVLPVVALTLSLYQEGTSLLKTQYENEKKQAEDNIKEQIKKLGEEKSLKANEISDNLDKLKKVKMDAELKLSFLEPKQQILKLFIPLAAAFVGINLALIYPKETLNIGKGSISVFNAGLFISVVFFIYALIILWSLLITIVEIKKAADENRSNSERDQKQLLLSILEKIQKGDDKFLDKVYISVEGHKIDGKEVEIRMNSQVKKELELKVLNSEKVMVKNLEIGLVFPTDMIVEDVSGYSIYRDQSSQIARYSTESLHGETNLIIKKLPVTPLTKGKFKIKTFINAENIKTTNRFFSVEVV